MTAKTFLIALICISAAMASGPVFILDRDAYDKGHGFDIEIMKFIIMTGIKLKMYSHLLIQMSFTCLLDSFVGNELCLYCF